MHRTSRFLESCHSPAYTLVIRLGLAFRVALILIGMSMPVSSQLTVTNPSQVGRAELQTNGRVVPVSSSQEIQIRVSTIKLLVDQETRDSIYQTVGVSNFSVKTSVAPPISPINLADVDQTIQSSVSVRTASSCATATIDRSVAEQILAMVGKDGPTSVKRSPVMTLINGRVAEMNDIVERPTAIGFDADAHSAIVERFEEGMTIRMLVKPGHSSNRFTTEIISSRITQVGKTTLPQESGDSIDFQVPIQQTQSVVVSAELAPNQCLLIDPQVTKVISTTEQSPTPMLGKIPYIGKNFSNTNAVEVDRNVLVLMIPTTATNYSNCLRMSETSKRTEVLTARWVVPIQGDPIHHGWIRRQGQTVVEIGSGPIGAKSTDLGDVAILPGLINAHTHLEFSMFDRPVGKPGIQLADWIHEVIEARGATTAEDRTAAIEKGMMESAKAGVRLVGEIATPPIDYPAIDMPMEMIHFCEVIGLSQQRSAERFDAAVSHASLLDNESASTGQVDWSAISPHAPYSTLPDTIDRCVAWSAQHHRPLAMHVAESPSERELLVNGTGPMAESLKRLGVFDASLFPSAKTTDGSPFIDLIRQLSKCDRGLLVHCNDLQPVEIEVLSRFSNLSVVFCPRTHRHFGFDRHPIAEMSDAGINIALGTDSRASNPDLNLWGEVQFLLNHRPDLDPSAVLAMATQNGADAVGREDLGRIVPGSNPGFITVATEASKVDQLYRDFATGEPPVCVGG